jgi:hypothetical protein
MADPAALKTSFQVPADAQPGSTIHIIAEATDGGTPPLPRTPHLIITIDGAAGPGRAAGR